VIQILADWPGGLKLARTRYATGWIAGGAKLSPPIPDTLRDELLHGERATPDDDVALKVAGVPARCPAGTLVPVLAGATPRARISPASVFQVANVSGLHPARRPLTRRALLTEAFRFLDAPYGWGGGGSKGGDDFLSLVMDLFATSTLCTASR